MVIHLSALAHRFEVRFAFYKALSMCWTKVDLENKPGVRDRKSPWSKGQLSYVVTHDVA